MSLVLALLVVSVLFLASSNGANDNFKGVATLYGSGTCTYRTALVWATLTTLAGSLLALVLAHGLVATFRGKGLVPDAVTAQPAFLLAVSLGAALTVMVATRTGMPVSTTHALTGGLVGAGLVAAPGDVRFEALGGSFVVPLLLSPVVAILLTVLVYPLFRWTRRRSGVTTDLCVCVGTSYEQVVSLPNGTLALVSTGVAVEVGRTEECVERYRGRVLGADAGRVVDGLHFLSGGAVGFARGLNDTPKIVALLLAGEAVHPTLGLAAVALVMAVGGVLNARRVAETMSRKITQMSPGQGFTANLVTALLVAGASRLGLPVSTTHVSVGSVFGIAAVNRRARVRTVLAILVAWATTLPTGAALAAVA
ncbi:MAG: inorganic phosphate transporter, partial [Gemmata sp.]